MEINDCLQMLESLISGDFECEEFAIQFPKKLELLEDEYIYEILSEVPALCSDFLSKKLNLKDFMQRMLLHYNEIKKSLC